MPTSGGPTSDRPTSGGPTSGGPTAAAPTAAWPQVAGVDLVALRPWFLAHGLAEPVAVARIHGGHSNITCRVRATDGSTSVLRRPPLGPLEPTAHDVIREARVIAAVGPSGVPAPRIFATCQDPALLGAPFFVMSDVVGVVLASSDGPVLDLDNVARHRAAAGMVSALAALHLLDPADVGLADLSRRGDGYLERQVTRWGRQWSTVAVDDHPLVTEVAALILAQAPPQQRVSVVHGDARLGNAIVAGPAQPAPGTVLALLDWELCALGDPLADLAYLMLLWTDDSSPATPRQLDATAAGGFPDHMWLASSYAAATGLDVSALPQYLAFQAWRAAIIVEGVRARYLRGGLESAAVDTAEFRRDAESLLHRAHDLLR